MRKKITFVIGVCILLAISFFSGCINVPKELTQMSIVSFDVEPGIINQGEFANLSWVVISASSINIDNGIGRVALTGHRIIQPTQNTTYILTASNATATRTATVTITVKNNENISGGGGSTKAPVMAFNKQTTPSKGLTLVSADLGLYWEDFIITGAVSPTGAVIAGQFIPLSGTTGTITIVHKPTNTLMGTWTWADSSGNRIAVIDTTMGTIRVQLYEDKMPITTANFIKLANDGFYDGLVFHRVIDNFMIQGGGFYPNGTQKRDPYGTIKLETSPDVLHVDGAISMARLSSPVDSATSQFFICDGAQSSLDGQYAAFGKVIDGMDVVRAIAAVKTTTKYVSYENWPVNDVIINSITIVSS
jgi:peptidyl-prolyl cis-trans isomerase A (cyclophilin A)